MCRIYTVLCVSAVITGPLLAQVDDQDVVRGLVTATRDNDPRVRQAAFVALSKVGKDGMTVIAAIQNGLEDDDENVRVAALKTLGKAVKDVDLKSRMLVELLDDKSAVRVDEFGDELPSVNKLARQQLRKIGAPAAQHLIMALKIESRKVSALRVLKMIGSDAKDAAPAVAELLKDGDADVRRAAVSALAVLNGDPKIVVPQLTQMLEDKDAGVRGAAVSGLAQFGSGAKDAVPDLLGLLKDEDANVRRLAARCLGEVSANDGRPPNVRKEFWQFAGRILRDLDSNKDGKLDAKEWENFGDDLKTYDHDSDGFVTQVEIATQMAKAQGNARGGELFYPNY